MGAPSKVSTLVALALVAGAAACNRKPDAGAQAKEKSQAQADNQAAPTQSKAELDAPLATIDGQVITLREFQERINRQSPHIRTRYTSLEQKKEFLDNLVRFEILATEAFRRGLDKDAEVVRTMKQVMIQKLMKDEFDTKVTPDAITDTELRAYYDANLADYVQPEEVRASAMIFKNRAQANRVLPEAKGEPGKTNKGFRDLVAKYSSDEDTKLRGGDLRYATVDNKELPAPVVKAMFALAQTGDVSDVVDAGNGTFYILKQTGRRKASSRSFEDAKAQIRNTLFRERRTDAQKKFIDKLKASAKIVIDEANLERVRIEPSGAATGVGSTPSALMPPTSANAPPPVAPGTPTQMAVPPVDETAQPAPTSGQQGLPHE